jgi:hypothetical protein
MNWQAIETAPKTGEEILVCYRQYPGSDLFVHVAFWMAKLDFDPENAEGWWSYIRSETTRYHLDGWCAPTHWCPIPEGAPE